MSTLYINITTKCCVEITNCTKCTCYLLKGNFHQIAKHKNPLGYKLCTILLLVILNSNYTYIVYNYDI